jgi:WD40 repeat protein
MNDHVLLAMVAAGVVLQPTAGPALGQIKPELAMDLLPPTQAQLAPMPASPSSPNSSPLPVVSFATQDGLFSILANGEDRQQLMAGEDSLFFAIDWAPAGDRVAVVRNFGQVYAMDLGAMDLEQTVSPPLFDSDCLRPPTLDLAWQQNGQTLVIQQLCDPPVTGAPGSQDIFLAQLGGPLNPLEALPDQLQSALYLSPTATAVAYVANQHIYILGTDAALPRQVTQSPGIYGAAGSPLVWSPDGSQLAFYEGNYPFQQINVINTDGSNRRVLTPDPDFQIYRSQLAWSPDGTAIAFYQPSDPPHSNQEAVSLINLDSGELEVLTRPGFYNALSWSPDGQQLALASGTQFEQQAMFVLNLVSRDFTVLTPQPFQNVLTSAWSPAGDWIAFSATPLGDELGRQMLYTVRPDASDLKALTSSEEYVYPFAWRP